ncbi:hypothetical protein FisN_UnNu064 [Fistulifera solaris]|uniref:Uncharacterized protein n=1 Tax=Fistulifera solaris TaxID=1519565 RepID=A0A1Z5JPE1_FISSO|nr:hypothetical protein FisN_UnNu064 [Fistulifera solaris]|eukprot:GAX15913.1 hypothetical protein FisN_UnNu064 [Fistulifera solaris]
MMKINQQRFFGVLAVLFLHLNSSCDAFLQSSQHHSTLLFVGGKGWENNNYLDSLSGNEQDREKAQQEYREFHDSRQAFLQRQQQRSQTPEGQRFLREQQQQQRAQQSSNNFADDDGTGDFFAQLGESSGGSRFRKVMQQAQRQQQKSRTTFIDPATGLEMKFAVPLDDEDGK